MTQLRAHRVQKIWSSIWTTRKIEVTKEKFGSYHHHLSALRARITRICDACTVLAVQLHIHSSDGFTGEPEIERQRDIAACVCVVLTAYNSLCYHWSSPIRVLGGYEGAKTQTIVSELWISGGAVPSHTRWFVAGMSEDVG